MAVVDDDEDDLLLGLWCEDLFISKNETELNNLPSLTPTQQNKTKIELCKYTFPANFKFSKKKKIENQCYILSLLETGEGHEKDRSLKQSSISTEVFFDFFI